MVDDNLTQEDIDKVHQITDHSDHSITREEAEITMFIMSQSFKAGAVLGFAVAVIAFIIIGLAAKAGGLI